MSQKHNISFVKASLIHLELIKEWLNSPHVQEFFGTDKYTWNNFKENVTNNKKELFDYWVAYYDEVPFSLIMTTDASEDSPAHLIPHIGNTGDTLTVDYLIGNQNYLGKGLSYVTLKAFQDYLDNKVSALLIDPEADNVKAIHVYNKAGFTKVATFKPTDGEFADKEHYLMKWTR